MVMTASAVDTFLRNNGPALMAELNGSYNRYPSEINNLFGVRTTNRHLEKSSGLSGMTNMTKFNGAVDYQDVEKLWDKTVNFARFATGIVLDPDLIEDNDVQEAMVRMTSFGESIAESREAYAAAVWNNMNATTFTYEGQSFDNTTPDGIAICSASHPRSPSVATTHDNHTTNAFSDANLEAARAAMRTTLNHKGKKIQVNPDTLVVGPYLEEDAKQILPAVQVPGNANNDNNPLNPANGVNVWPGGLRLIVWNYLDGTTAANTRWFLVDSRLLKRSLIWWDRKPPEFMNEKDIDTFTVKYNVNGRWATMANDWRAIYGNFPT